MANVPQFIGIGVPKAGTTWISHILSQHPQVYIPAGKEIDYFSYRCRDLSEDDYLSLFDKAPTGSLCGEYSVGYFEYPGTPDRIRAMLPDVKLIISVRSPAAQVYSYFWHRRRQNFGRINRDYTNLTFDDALSKFGEQLLGPVRYGTHFKRWLDFFPSEQIHVVLFDDIRERPVAVRNQLYGFLGLDVPEDDADLPGKGSKSREGVSVRSGLIGRLYPHVYRLVNQRLYRPLIRVFGYDRMNAAKEMLRVRQTFERLFFQRGYPPMSREQVEHVWSLVGDEVALFESLTGISLETWRNSDEVVGD